VSDIDVIPYLSALPEGMDAARIKEEYELIKRGLLNLYENDRGMFGVAAGLVKERLRIGRRDLKAGLKPLREDAGEGSSQAPLLVEHTSQATLFHTPDGEAWITIPLEEHEEHWPLRTRGCRRWLARQFYEEEGKAPGSQTLQDALGVLEGKALYEGEERTVAVRIADHDRTLYLDLANEQWQAVEITPTA
jgi:hypothetical protein